MQSVEQRILHSAAASSVSTLTTSIRSNNAPASSQETPKKRGDINYHWSPSPKKPAPNFEVTPSDDNSAFSGDNPDSWEKEEEMMMALISEQNRKEREEAENEKDMGVVPEMVSFMINLEELDKAEQNPSKVLVTKMAVFKKMKVSELKDLHNLLCVSLPSDKKKPSLLASKEVRRVAKKVESFGVPFLINL
jgi:hypothetical protein